jgi:ATP-binding cassette subfamily B protein
VTLIAATRPERRDDPLAHVKAAEWGKGLGTLWRITRLTARHPWQASISILATIIACTFQLIIPRLLGRAVDEAQGILKADTAVAAEHALLITALTLLAVSVLRGFFTMAQNYYGDAVGHHLGYELRLAT